jgi:hypothetical protein
VIEDHASGVSAHLEIRPIARPLFAHNQELCPGSRLHWIVFPRASVRGELAFGGVRRNLAGVTAYHDHNWGGFSWGGDFAWEWGAILANGAREPWTILYSNLQDAARSCARLQQIFVWRGESRVLSASQSAVRVSESPADRAWEPFRLPPVMSLLMPKLATRGPGALRIQADGKEGTIELAIRLESAAQIVVPSEREPTRVSGLTELVGRAEMKGRLGGVDVRAEGSCVVELAGI